MVSTDDWPLLAGVSLLQVAIAATLRMVRWSAVRRVVSPLRAIAQPLVGAPEGRVLWAIEASGRRMPGLSTCLVRALVAGILLGSRDHPVRVTIGVRRTPDGMLESHAWVERDGLVIVGELLGRAPFVPMITWESPSAD